MVDTEQSGRYISDHPLFKELKCANPNNISSGYKGGYIVGRSQKVPHPKVPVFLLLISRSAREGKQSLTSGEKAG